MRNHHCQSRNLLKNHKNIPLHHVGMDQGMNLSTVGMDSNGNVNEVIRWVWISGMDLSTVGMDSKEN